MAEAFTHHPDIDVDFVFSGRPSHEYFDMECFGQYQCFPGLTFCTQNGRVSQWQTLRQARPIQLYKDIRQLDVSQYDLLLNDFEPVTAWAAQKHGLPSISISHQAAFSYRVPKIGNSFADNLIMKRFAPTDIQLGVHWYHFDHPILPPFVVDKAVKNPSKDFVLVYLPFENLADIKLLLEPLTEQRFMCFHPKVTAANKDRHIQWLPPSKEGFRHALQHCAGVIGNGGFELASESLQLGKKLLIKPLNGQFEQMSNLLTLNQLGLCEPLYQLDTDTVEEWITAADNEAVVFPDDPSPLITWLKQGDWHNTSPLCKAMWEQVKFGIKTHERLLSLAF
jgi:uncharacterized protein (TIGR00661 family)